MIRNVRGRKKRKKRVGKGEGEEEKRFPSISLSMYPPSNLRPDPLMLATEMLRRCQLCVQTLDKGLGGEADR